jgi:hypothetical protein
MRGSDRDDRRVSGQIAARRAGLGRDLRRRQAVSALSLRVALPAYPALTPAEVPDAARP